MQVAITGSSGLIGRALTRSLRDDGHAVVRVVRGGSPPDGTTGSAGSVTTLRWDPDQGEIDAAGLEGVDAVVHLAGAGVGDRRWTKARKRLIRDSRVRGTTLLAETLARLDRPPAVLVSASGVHHYGDRGDEILTEASSPGHGFLAEEVVRPWEQATAPAAEAGIRTVVTRMGVVLSAHGGALPKLLTLFRLGLGGRMGSGRQWFSWITLADEVDALRFLLEADGTGGAVGTAEPVSGPVNLTSPQPVTNRQLTAALGKALHRPTLLPVPRFGPRLVLGRQMADEVLFMSMRVVPEVLQAAGYRHHHPDIDTALEAVLHEPAPDGPDRGPAAGER